MNEESRRRKQSSKVTNEYVMITNKMQTTNNMEMKVLQGFL